MVDALYNQTKPNSMVHSSEPIQNNCVLGWRVKYSQRYPDCLYDLMMMMIILNPKLSETEKALSRIK